MRVLHVINNLEIGGAEVLLQNLVPHLRESGVQVAVYALRLSGTVLEENISKAGIPLFGQRRMDIYSPAHIVLLARHLAKHPYDVVHVHLFPAQLWAACANILLKRKVPLITTEHNTYNRRRKPFFRPLDRWMYTQYRMVTCISKAVAEKLVNWIPDIAERVVLIPNGIPTERFRKATPANKVAIVGKTAPVVIFVARFEAQKDHATLIRAIQRLPEVQLVLVGDGVLRTEVEQLAKNLGVADRVHFLGKRSDVAGLLKAADVYVQSSHWEGFGIAVLEAMAAGVPVVASKVPGLEEVVGDAGLLFDPGDSEQLAARVQLLLTDANLRQELIRRGQARASQFSIEQVERQLLELYQRVVHQ